MAIPGIDTVYEILKRHIERENDVFAQRRLAGELMINCKEWSRVLIDVFRNAIQRWATEGREAAAREILEQERDFLKLDYSSLKSESPILVFLAGDPRFRSFADACADFYQSALSTKRLVHGCIETHPGEYVFARDVGTARMVELWEAEVERMLEKVAYEHMRVKTFVPR